MASPRKPSPRSEGGPFPATSSHSRASAMPPTDLVAARCAAASPALRTRVEPPRPGHVRATARCSIPRSSIADSPATAALTFSTARGRWSGCWNASRIHAKSNCDGSECGRASARLNAPRCVERFDDNTPQLHRRRSGAGASAGGTSGFAARGGTSSRISDMLRRGKQQSARSRARPRIERRNSRARTVLPTQAATGGASVRPLPHPINNKYKHPS